MFCYLCKLKCNFVLKHWYLCDFGQFFFGGGIFHDFSWFFFYPKGNKIRKTGKLIIDKDLKSACNTKFVVIHPCWAVNPTRPSPVIPVSDRFSCLSWVPQHDSHWHRCASVRSHLLREDIRNIHDFKCCQNW